MSLGDAALLHHGVSPGPTGVQSILTAIGGMAPKTTCTCQTCFDTCRFRREPRVRSRRHPSPWRPTGWAARQGIRFRRRRLSLSGPGRVGPFGRDVDHTEGTIGRAGRAQRAGKTALIKLLTRLYERPTKGSIFLDGRNLRIGRQKTCAERIGVIFQDFNRVPVLGARKHRPRQYRSFRRRTAHPPCRGSGGADRSSTSFRRGSTRRSAGGFTRASSFRADNGKSSLSRARSCVRRRTFWSSTNRPPSPRRRSGARHLRAVRKLARAQDHASHLAPVSRPCAWPTEFSCSRRGASSKKEAMPTSSRGARATRGCSRCRRRVTPSSPRRSPFRAQRRRRRSGAVVGALARRGRL